MPIATDRRSAKRQAVRDLRALAEEVHVVPPKNRELKKRDFDNFCKKLARKCSTNQQTASLERAKKRFMGELHESEDVRVVWAPKPPMHFNFKLKRFNVDFGEELLGAS